MKSLIMIINEYQNTLIIHQHDLIIIIIIIIIITTIITI